jgi:hypothetical protein
MLSLSGYDERIADAGLDRRGWRRLRAVWSRAERLVEPSTVA